LKFGVGIGLGDDPGRGVADGMTRKSDILLVTGEIEKRKGEKRERSLPDTEVENFALKDKGMKGVHDFLDRSRVIPPKRRGP
jgi:hypothetical protein